MPATATTIALTTAANANSAANAAAQEAARKACMAYVRGYTHDAATIEEMRSYAECIDRLHPAEMTAGELGIAKVVVMVLIAAMLAGILWDFRTKTIGGGWFGHILGGSFVGLCIGGLALMLVGGVAFGLRILAV